MTERKSIAEIQNLPVAELQDELSALNAAQLAELRALEAKESNRVTALAAIDAAIAAAPKDSAPGSDVQSNPSNAEAPVTATPLADPSATAPKPQDWQKPEYDGPLDIEQMDWRRRNIKPVRQVKTK